MKRWHCLLTVAWVLQGCVPGQTSESADQPAAAPARTRDAGDEAPPKAAKAPRRDAKTTAAKAPRRDPTLATGPELSKSVKRSTGSRGVLPAVAVSGRAIHLVWVGKKSIRYRRSADGGNGWSDERVLARAEGIANFGIRPSLAVSGDSVHVAWAERGPTFRGRTSGDQGTSWGDPWALGPGRSLALTAAPKTAAPHATVYAVTADDRGLWCRQRTRSGNIWSDPVRVMPLDAGWTQVAAATSDLGLHLAVWHFSDSSLRREISYVKSRAGCGEWEPVQPLVPPVNCQTPLQDLGNPRPAIVAFDQRVVALWSGLPGRGGASDRDTLFSRSCRGSEWLATTRLDRSPIRADLRAKDMAAGGGKVRVVSNLGYWESRDGGETWSKPIQEWSGESIATDGAVTSIVGVERTRTGNSIVHLRVP